MLQLRQDFAQYLILVDSYESKAMVQICQAGELVEKLQGGANERQSAMSSQKLKLLGTLLWKV
jgi:hypothetical protein